MRLKQRIDSLIQLGAYMVSGNTAWLAAKEKASAENAWFTPEFIELAVKNINLQFLQRNKLEEWAAQYQIADEKRPPKNIGLIMAGNIPLVGFHDFLCTFISGHKQTIKPSSKDSVLIKHLAGQLTAYEPESKNFVSFSEMLKECDAYIATGSNNSARYFEYYFSKYPHIIRRNRTSVALLNGSESKQELERLADDVYLYFGLGCRNVTKIFVPESYDFVPLINAFKKYNRLIEQHKYKNNYDYQLAILIINKKFYMTDGSVIITENSNPFSPIAVLHFEQYKSIKNVIDSLNNNDGIQCIISNQHTSFGLAQQPALQDYADGIDTMKFLCGL
ncbi:MAG: acyl-CoA reductase [Bacteroidetes bacterium]|nr:acyl-CoA reductase [Bacteroidota bacterium]MBS1973720.1 acyl-CoA reductase [Bacteroidota bacterium]